MVAGVVSDVYTYRSRVVSSSGFEPSDMVYVGSSAVRRNGASPQRCTRIFIKPRERSLTARKRAEKLEVLHEDVRIVRDHVAPAAAIGGLCDRHFDDAKIQRLPVGADQETIVDMIDLILVIFLARQHHFEIELRIVGARITPLRRVVLSEAMNR